MECHEQVVTVSQTEPAERVRRTEPTLHRDETVDHRVPDEVDSSVRDPLGPKVGHGLVAVDEEVLRELISQDLQLLRNRIGSIPHWRNILELPQESIEEVLRLVIPGSQES